MRWLLLISFLGVGVVAPAQGVTLAVDPTLEKKPISPYLYGGNGMLPGQSSTTGSTAAQWVRLRESGMRFLRQGGGNNSTKYNWRKRLSSHPDWYNNVYTNDWDKAVRLLQDSLASSVTGMWSFQLIGKVAATSTANFDDWGYNRSQWWTGVNQNLAGGGTLNPAGGNQALTNGNPDRYLQDWPADSTVGLLDHWRNRLSIPDGRLTYWNMDNEPEIWNGTHDDVVNNSLSAEAFMQRYFAVAKQARARFPGIKLVGPATANEWHWYHWMNRTTLSDGQYLSWLAYFIKRCAEEQKASGVRLLDVLDLHFYPGESSPEQIVQLHRVFFDQTYDYPGANGVKDLTGNWNSSLTKEYIFGRVNDWLTQYMGPNHGVKLGITEIDVKSSDPSVTAVWYASMLGEFMQKDVAIFTPWSWKVGMWETLHLFARYNQITAVKGTSSNETLVSAYPSVNRGGDTLTVVLVNRSTTAGQIATLNIANFKTPTAPVQALRLAALPAEETFVSHSKNALQPVPVYFAGNAATLTLPPLSITTMTLTESLLTATEPLQKAVSVFPNPGTGIVTVDTDQPFETLTVVDAQGRRLYQFKQPTGKQYDLSALPHGVYTLLLESAKGVQTTRFIKR
ncbi:glycoside hydrolase family 44 protein [Spirosoma sp.]|uniref:glycoside hydrolase family 44 protein n=1 Tax=Spirosoma sp. TaxID=1899569 RepID=UPI002624ECE2|nr:glycoside hydrolase family 44 protein [Spirosoma sp.]MCX6219228.1 T9SS type A sorting domain-containing protein [Spirosoma sp.]